MPKLVVEGATLACDRGTAPGSLRVLPLQETPSEEPPATVEDHIVTVNIPTFGLCRSTTNPAVASATSAALGVLTLRPCLPVTPSAWSPGSAIVSLGGSARVLGDDSNCRCTWGGTISIVDPASMVEID